MNVLTETLGSLKRMNWLLNAAVLGLMLVGILFVYSASYVNEDQVRNLYQKQMLWAVVGWFCCFLFAMVDYRRILKLSWPLYGAALVLLVIVLLAGRRVYGATRWIVIMGFQMQPSELAKLAVVLVVTRLFAYRDENENPWKPFLLGLFVMGIPMLLIMKQPDLGTAMVLVPTVFLLMFVGGAPMRAIVGLVLTGLLAAGILLGVLFLPAKAGMSQERQERWFRLTGLSEYQRDRIMVFFDSDTDPLGAGWNKLQSEIAVGSGGVWGKGFRQGTQNILGYLPRSVAPTDFIYSVIAEESGFAGSMVVLGLFTTVIVASLGAAVMAQDRAGRLLCVRIATLLFTHVFVNMAITVGLMAITGLPLPLLSYGGSFMMLIMSGVGLVQSVFIRSRQERDYEDAVVPGVSGLPFGGYVSRKVR